MINGIKKFLGISKTEKRSREEQEKPVQNNPAEVNKFLSALAGDLSIDNVIDAIILSLDNSSVDWRYNTTNTIDINGWMYHDAAQIQFWNTAAIDCIELQISGKKIPISNQNAHRLYEATKRWAKNVENSKTQVAFRNAISALTK